MRVSTLRTVAVVALLVLAGCSGVVSQDDRASTTATAAADESSTNQGYSVTVVSQTSGSDGVNFYVSDEENAIDDFRHLNVTITRVGFQRAGDGGNESEGGWVERDVDNRSVDLTRLKGANATRLTTVDAPNGSYDKVFAYVNDVNATLTSGEQVRVKLPSEKLQMEKPFTVGDGESVDFVFDIAVHEAGGSGKYILKPVIGESGTDVPVKSVDEDEDEREGTLDVAFVGNVTRGDEATLEVTRNGTAVENATVTIDDEQVGTTDADGRVTVPIPDAEEVEIEVEAGDAETELELKFGDEAEKAETEDDESEETEAEEESEDEAETEDEDETDEEETDEEATDEEDTDDEETEEADDETTESTETAEATETTESTES